MAVWDSDGNLLNMTDAAADIDEEDRVTCDQCKGEFDDGCEGHIDEITSLAFCSIECEGAYDTGKGLPLLYRLPPFGYDEERVERHERAIEEYCSK